MCILNTEGCNIFESLNSDEYSEALDLLRDYILATDLALHFHNKKEHEEMVRNKYNKDDLKQRKLLFEMLMTCCDLSDQTKDWKISKKIAVSLTLQCVQSVYSLITINKFKFSALGTSIR